MNQVKPASPSLLKAGLSGVVIFGVIVFAVIAMNTGDLLWFWPVFNQVPVEITLNCYGTQVTVKPGQPAYQAVTDAVNSSLTGNKRWDDLSLSESTYQEYQTSSDVMVLKLQYDPPATIHSTYAFFKAVNWLIFPLDGRHSSANTVFGMEGKFISPGSYHVKDTALIVTTLKEQGVCTKHESTAP
jgi:hypothetical protein